MFAQNVKIVHKLKGVFTDVIDVIKEALCKCVPFSCVKVCKSLVETKRIGLYWVTLKHMHLKENDTFCIFFVYPSSRIL